MNTTHPNPTVSTDISVQEAMLQPADLEVYVHELPVAAAVLPRLQSMLLSEGTDIADVVDLVMLDPGLAARVMHAAASSIYGRGEPIRSLEEALARLGSDEVFRITAAFAMSRFLNKTLCVYGLGPEEYWRRSLACAFAMVDLAPANGLDDRVAYTVGLLHGLGMVFIDHHLRATGNARVRLAEHSTRPLPVQELSLTGMTHAQVAGIVLRAWNFSEEVVAPIENQFDPIAAGLHRPMTALLAEAREVASEIVGKLPSAGSVGGLSSVDWAGDDWSASIAAQILVIEGSMR